MVEHALPQSVMSDHGPLHLDNTGIEDVGFSPIRRTLHASNAKRREGFLRMQSMLRPCENFL